MNKDFITLGIETSCDDTAVAVLKGQNIVLSEFVSSQIEDHAAFGGVVPEFASRKHMEALLPLVQAALSRSGIKDPSREIDLIAVTCGPGLMGSLMVGVMTAKGLSQSWGVPLLGVNHLEGHIFANLAKEPSLSPPFLSMIVSGGHTEIILVRSFGDYSLLGATRDDAAGEAYDKVAKLLDLGYPGGPLVDKAAALGSSEKIVFPVPMKTKKEIAFSFSGLKTAVLWEVKKFRENDLVPPVNDICASFQKAAVESLICKLDLAHEMTDIAKITLSGGVAANSQLRRSLEEFALSRDLEIFIPPVARCTDNAVMIAAAGYNSYMRGERSDLTLSPSPSLLITSQRNNG